jgi:hypothetical protein
MSVKKFATSYPTTFGAVIGVVFLGSIFAIEMWFPRVGDAWDRHEKMVRSIWCTLALFVICIYHLWSWRHGRGFWPTLSVFFMLHVLGVFLYSTWVHPLLLGEWVMVLLFEAVVIVYPLRWVLQRFDHHGQGAGGWYEER